ncbi:High-affinity nitrate transporter 3.1 [Capsicum annuum]|uniref:High-affinity nitrate transporter n=1 Tax=Capsicum annuum TaxID=4072 RepID=Q8S343_CAPAN|nr:high-affinity nitrate transporter 3.2-like precursor [Capsicum annuum]AAM12786.1 unknown [Capsicum annuum]KAF3624488.1 High-affinity nitrate transporter 3.1 [Capsicum annuum]
MASTPAIFLATLVICCSLSSSHAEILFSSLKKSLEVTVKHRAGVLMAGEDTLEIDWFLNKTFPAGTDSAYKTIKLKLCYAPISQKDRAWRKTEDHIKKDKTCQFQVDSTPYKSSNNKFNWTIERDVPTGTFFVRAYILNGDGHEIGYGQNTDDKKVNNLFDIQAISGRHATLDICSVVFSAFAVVSLFGFFYMEKRNAKASK